MSNFYNQQYSSTSRSPPPLQHPVPTHPAYIPDPPSTPVSPQGYMRFTSSPPNPNDQPQPQTSPAYGQNKQYPQGAQYGAPQFQSFAGGAPPQQPAANFAQWGVNPATAQFGMQLGQSAVAAGQEYVQRNFGNHIQVPRLKHHFNVSNSYVIRKIRLILFPWRHKRWTRSNRPSEQGQAQWLPPRDDLNAPDLYIPVMAFVTYILLAALQSGLQDRFHPEVLGKVASRAMAIVLAEFFFIIAGCYFLNITGSSQVTDLFAYVGYKFVGVIACLLMDLLNLGRSMYLVVFVYALCSNGFFLLRALKYVVLPDPRDAAQHVGTLSPAQRSRRIWFLFAISASQTFYMGLLVRV
ncbi:protein transporter yif1 [Rickenella mellea]|uniref:Protein YIF1 n=1 Tax=Rickenella mellea TaxID=50990 RepID=A0A4Y7PXV9_9AGAM|nr:protein transporter yif1 [Rickenella mellea]